jgi:hypothetical protein
VSLDYWSVNRVNPGVVTYQDTVFALNGAFDPEVTGVGHQPRDYDTWSAVYGKYRVRRTLVEIDVRQRAAHGLVVTCVPSNSATALVVTDYPQELPRAVMLGVTGSSQPVAKLRAAFDPRAVLGMTPTEFLGDDSTGALVTANPSQLVYLHVFAAQLDGTTACDFEFSLRMRMEVEFYDRKVLSPSSLLRENALLRERLRDLGDEPAPPPSLGGVDETELPPLSASRMALPNPAGVRRAASQRSPTYVNGRLVG